MPISFTQIASTINSFKENRARLDLKQEQESQAYLSATISHKTTETLAKLKGMLGESIVDDFGIVPVVSSYREGLAHIVEVGLSFDIDDVRFTLDYHPSGYHSIHGDLNPNNQEFPLMESDHFRMLAEPINPPPALAAAIEAAIATTTPPPSPLIIGGIGTPFQAFVPSLNAYATYDQNPDNPTVVEIFYLAIDRGVNAVASLVARYS